jgi:hypothetical protein
MPIDYATLAQLARPQMMGNAPIGGGLGAGMMYGQDLARQDEFIRQAASLAELAAQSEGRKAEIEARGHGGKLMEADLATLMSDAKLKAARGGGLDNIINQPNVDRQEQESRMDKANKDLVIALADDNDEKTSKAAYDELSRRGHPAGKLDYDKAKARAKALVYGGREGHRQQMEKEGQKGQNALTVKEAELRGRKEIQATIAANKEKMDALKKQNPTLYSLVERAAEGDAVAMEAVRLIGWTKILPGLQQGANQAEQANAILGPGSGIRMPTPTPVIPAPGQAAAPKSFPEPNQKQIDLLNKDPSLKEQFEKKFGPGSAAKHMKGK